MKLFISRIVHCSCVASARHNHFSVPCCRASFFVLPSSRIVLPASLFPLQFRVSAVRTQQSECQDSEMSTISSKYRDSDISAIISASSAVRLLSSSFPLPASFFPLPSSLCRSECQQSEFSSQSVRPQKSAWSAQGIGAQTSCWCCPLPSSPVTRLVNSIAASIAFRIKAFAILIVLGVSRSGHACASHP